MNRKYQFNLLLAFFVFVHISNGQQATTRKYAIRNVKVIPMSKEISLPEQAVLIENGIIKKIRSTASIRTGNGITVIEGSAKYLLPGLLVCIHISLMSRANIRTPAKQN